MLANLHHIYAALTVSKAAFALMKLGSGLGSHSSPSSPCCSSNIPHLAEASHYSCNGLTSTSMLPLLYTPRTARFHYLDSNNRAGQSLLLLILKTSRYFRYFFSETIIPGTLWVRTKNSEQMTQENEEQCTRYNYTLCIWAMYGD